MAGILRDFRDTEQPREFAGDHPLLPLWYPWNCTPGLFYLDTRSLLLLGLFWYPWNCTQGLFQSMQYSKCDMCVMMWHVCDDVTCVWWCGMCAMMWHVCDDVACVRWCDMCVMKWHVCDDVTCVWWCDMCAMMWHVCDDVACVRWCDMCVMMWHVCDDVTWSTPSLTLCRWENKTTITE